MTLHRRHVIGGLAAFGAGPACAQDLRLGRQAALSGRLFGAAIEPGPIATDSAFRSLVATQCSLITPENAMKWDALRPAPGIFDFADADAVVAYARQIGAMTHGHCLVWHEALPPWFPKRPSSRQARDLLERHIAKVARRYAGRMRSWDVINEPVERNDRRADGLRRSVWLEALGPDYLAIALQAAHEADPTAKLAISDYGLEYDHISWMVEKRQTMLSLLRALTKTAAPLHALALQGHLLGEEPASFGRGFADFLKAVADLGLEILVTELDVNEQGLSGPAAARDRTVADIYSRFTEAVLAEPAVTEVTTWGLADRYTSKATMFPHADGEDVRPLPFDRDLQPKPAAWALAHAFESARR